MSNSTRALRTLVAAGMVSLLGACAQPYGTVASNPPPASPGPDATWFHIEFATASYTLDPQGQRVVADLVSRLRQSPDLTATIVGKTDTVGTPDYNMHLSHQRADAVRDALVYQGNVPADRVETRWTGEQRQRVATADNVALASNRVVDIAIH